MNISKKQKCVILILEVVLMLPLLRTQVAWAGSFAQEKTLSFLTDVIMLDIAKYNATLLSDRVSFPDEYGGIAQEEVRYLLDTKGSKLDVTALFGNETLSWCTLYVLEGVPLYTETPPANVLEMAEKALERYENYTGSSRYREMSDILDMVAKAENAVVTMGNLKLKVSIIDEVYTNLEWVYVYDNLEISGLLISFLEGVIETFFDKGSIFRVGSTAVNVSKEKAIDIAIKRAEDFSWTVDGVEIKDFTILKEPVSAELSMQAREPLTLYPFWRVDLYLDKVYSGGVNSIAVGIWADTAEVRYCREMSLGGGPAPQPTGSTGINIPVEYSYATAAVIAIALATTTGYTYLKRKKHAR